MDPAILAALVFGIVAFGIVALVVGWFLRKAPSDAGTGPAEVWCYTDFDPPPKPHHDRAPDRAQHSLDRASRTWQYNVLTTWINADPYAESDTSVVRESFDVQRIDHRKWEIRLVMRNGLKIQGEPWRPAPAAFVGEWEVAYSLLPESHEALL